MDSTNGLFSIFKEAVLCSERCLLFPTKEMKALSQNLLNMMYQQVKTNYGWGQTNSKGSFLSPWARGPGSLVASLPGGLEGPGAHIPGLTVSLCAMG